MPRLDANDVTRINTQHFNQLWDDQRNDTSAPQEKFDQYANGPKPEISLPSTPNIGQVVLKDATQVGKSVSDAQQPLVKQ